jgi:hypothetical protein
MAPSVIGHMGQCRQRALDRIVGRIVDAKPIGRVHFILPTGGKETKRKGIWGDHTAK